MMSINVPSGKRVIIKKDGEIIAPNVKMLLDSEITLDFSSQFEELVSTSNFKFIKVISDGLQAITGMDINIGSTFEQFGMQVWKSSKPISIPNLTINFFMKTDAKTDVDDPIRELVKIPLPVKRKGDFSIGLIGPGPNIFEALDGQRKVGFAVNYSMQIGNLIFPWVIISKAEPTFSVDTDERGYHVWGEVALDVSTVFIATQEMVDDVFQNNYTVENR